MSDGSAGTAPNGANGTRSVPSSDHPAPARNLVSLRMLWFGLFAAPTAWAVQLMANYGLAAHSCFPAFYPLSTPTISGLRGIVFLVSVAASAVCLAGLLAALKAWNRTRSEEHDSSGSGAAQSEPAAALDTGVGRTRFMAMGGLLMSSIFLLASLAQLFTVFLVSPCAGG